MLRPRALFAYGTLWFPELFEAVTGQRPRSSEAVLADWTALRVGGAVYPGLHRAAGARTDGRVYFDVAAATWARLDRFGSTTATSTPASGSPRAAALLF